jgi:hypothetical protein
MIRQYTIFLLRKRPRFLPLIPPKGIRSVAVLEINPNDSVRPVPYFFRSNINRSMVLMPTGSVSPKKTPGVSARSSGC